MRRGNPEKLFKKVWIASRFALLAVAMTMVLASFRWHDNILAMTNYD